MMKGLKDIFPAVLMAFAMMVSSCMDLPQAYSDINTVAVSAIYPSGFEDFARDGVTVTARNSDNGDIYSAVTGPSGIASIALPDGLFTISISDKKGVHIFNGTLDKVVVQGDAELGIPLQHSEGGSLVFKEIYCGGCSMAPKEGTYQSDKYAIIHNNSSEVYYLDSLCIGSISPYNSTGTNPWISRNADGSIAYRDFVPIAQAVWQFGGDGKTFPLPPGGDAVVCFHGAIDHTVGVPLSVNLNNSSYFVCYNQTYFPNTTYHPAPGDKILPDHILRVVIKTGVANAYTVSLSSPGMVIFKARGTSIQEYVTGSDHILAVPGSSNDHVTAVPYSWILDAVEVFDGRSGSNAKRLPPALDAGFAIQSDIYKGRSLERYVNSEESAKEGYEILQDTNNSSNDFHERETQSLHE